MNTKYVLGFLLAMSVMFAVPTARAETTPAVILSEIAWAGSAQSTADEWIELANVGSASVDISGWTITGAGTGGATLTIPSETVLSQGSTLLIANYALGDEKTALMVAPDIVTTSISILNTDLAIALVDSSGVVHDTYSDSGTPNLGSSETYATIERDVTSLAWATAETSANLIGESPGSPGVIGHQTAPSNNAEDANPALNNPSVSETPGTEPETTPEPETPTNPIIINEFLPAPSNDGDEWVELYNTSDVAVNVEGLSLIDASGAITELTGTLAPLSYSIVLNPGGNLNNGGDTIALIDAATMVLDTITYGTDALPAPDHDVALALIDGVWTETVGTPGTVNVFLDPESLVIPTVNDASLNNSPDTSDSDTPTETVDPAETPTTDTSTDPAGPIDAEIIITQDSSSETSASNTNNTAEPVNESTHPAAVPAPQIGSIILNEILPSPSTGADEWVELANTTGSSITLDGLSLIDASDRVTALSGSVAAYGYVLYANPSGNLNNGGDTVTLTAADGTILDTVSYGTDALPAPDHDVALALIDGVWTEAVSTPGAANTANAASTASNPADSIASSSDAATSSNTSDSSSSTTTEATISPILYGTDPSNVAQSATTNNATTTASSAATSSTSTTTTPVATASTNTTAAHSTTTPATSIVVTQATPKTTAVKSTSTKSSSSKTSSVTKTTAAPRTISSTEFATIADDTMVTLEGIVVAQVGTLGKRSFFLDGVEIYQSQGALATVSVGDHVRITGEVSVLTNTRRINIQEGGVTVLGAAMAIPHDYEEDLPYGSLVRIAGTVSARRGDGIILATSSGEFLVIPGSNLVMDWETIAGKMVTVTGILKATDSDTRIVLRTAEDVVIAPEPTATLAGTVNTPSTSSKAPYVLAALGVIGAALLGAWFWRNRPRSSLTSLTLKPHSV